MSLSICWLDIVSASFSVNAMQCLEIAQYTWDLIDSKRYKIFKHTCTMYNNDYNMIVVQQCITTRKQF